MGKEALSEQGDLLVCQIQPEQSCSRACLVLHRAAIACQKLGLKCRAFFVGAGLETPSVVKDKAHLEQRSWRNAQTPLARRTLLYAL